MSLALVSCGDDDEGGGDGAAVQALTITMATDDGETSLDEGTAVGVMAVGQDDAVAAQAVVTAAAGGQLDGAAPVTAVMADGMRLCAYRPSTLWTADSYGQMVDFSVPADQSTADAYDAADLMLAPLTAVEGGRTHLLMSHMMAKVSVHITDVTGNYDMTEATMMMPGCNTTVTADLATATATTVDGMTADIRPYLLQGNAYRASASAVVAPGQRAAGSVLVSVTIDGETLTYGMSGADVWEAGKEYVYTMRLTNEGLVPYGSYVTDWDDDGGSLTGNAEELITYGVGDYLTSDGDLSRLIALQPPMRRRL